MRQRTDRSAQGDYVGYVAMASRVRLGFAAAAWSSEMHGSVRNGLGSSTFAGLGLTLGVLMLSGCATAPPAPTSSLTAARDAIATAEESDARQHAGAELDEARQQLVLAESAVVAERMVDADRFALQAQVSAELASARSEMAKATEINRQMTRGADALLEEIRRSGDQR